VRLLTTSSAVALLCISSVAAAQTTLTVHDESITCSDPLSVVDHGPHTIIGRVAAQFPPHSPWSDSRLVIDAAEPAGLIVGECRRTPQSGRIGEAVRMSGGRHLHAINVS
jgi:hypothetical protein